MLKNSIKKKITISLLSLIILGIIYILPNQTFYEENINYNDNVNYVYLLNNDKYLIRTTSLSNNNETIAKAKEIISDLTIGSNNQNYLNKDLKQLIPANTKIIDLSLKDNLLKINFTADILKVTANNEEKMLEAIIYSLTELKDIKGIIIFVEDKLLINLPHSKQPLPNILTRQYGINKIFDLTNLTNVNQMTIYYFTKYNGSYATVPVTIFTNNSKDKVEVIIKNLKSSLAYQTDLVSFLSDNAKLLDYEIEENKIKVNFSSYLLDDFYNDALIEEVKYAISYSLKDSLNLTDVEILINGQAI
jgi:germination protein M